MLTAHWIFLLIFPLRLLEPACLEFPLAADLYVLIMIKAGAHPAHPLAGIANFGIAASAGAAVTLKIDYMIMNIRARRSSFQRVGISLKKVGTAGGGILASRSNGREGAVLREQIHDAIHVTLPYTITISLR